MVKITSFEDSYYYPPKFPGLEELVRFPDGEFKRERIPNSTVWVFNKKEHRFQPEILSGDMGCGMAAFLTEEIEPKEAADKFFKYLRGKGILGRGNHFVDVCSPIFFLDDSKQDNYKIILIHTHGRNQAIPLSLEEAYQKQEAAAKERVNLGRDLIDLLKSKGELISDWPHNTVEETEDKIIYRKGAIKTRPKKIHILPAHLEAHILVYSVDGECQPIYASMPHATGRKKATKVTAEQASLLRKFVYIPKEIPDSSLKSEHPSGYNDFNKILERLGGKYFISIGEIEILSYIGKV